MISGKALSHRSLQRAVLQVFCRAASKLTCLCLSGKGFEACPGLPNSLHPDSMPLRRPKPQAINRAWWWISSHNFPRRHLFIAHSLLYASLHLRSERRCKDEGCCCQRINSWLELVVNLALNAPHQGHLLPRELANGVLTGVLSMTVVPPWSEGGVHSKVPSRCLKLGTVMSPIFTMFFPVYTHTYDKV